MNRYIRIIILSMLASFVAILCCASDVSALRGSEEDLLKLGLIDGVSTCYNKGDKYIMGSEIKKGDFAKDGINSIFGSKADSDGTVVIPTQIANTIEDYDLSCKQVFFGFEKDKQKVSGVNSLFGTLSSLAEYGYIFDKEKYQEVEEETGGTSQVEISFSVKDGSGVNTKSSTSTGKVTCTGEQEVDKKGRVYWWTISCAGSAKVSYSGTEYGVPFENYFTLNGSEYGVGFEASNAAPSHHAGFLNSALGVDEKIEVSSASVSYKTALTTGDGGGGYGNFYDELKDDIEDCFHQAYTTPLATVTITEAGGTTSGGDPVETDDSYMRFVASSSFTAAAIAEYNYSRKSSEQLFVSSVSSNKDGRFSTASAVWEAPYTYHLYYRYLQRFMNDSRFSLTVDDCTDTMNTEAAYFFKNAEDQWCVINIPGSSTGVLNMSVAVVSNKHLVKGTFNDVIEWFKQPASYDGLEADDYANGDTNEEGTLTPESDPGAEEQEKEKTCYDDAGSLGWVLCPIIDSLSKFILKLYIDWIEPSLVINAKLFDTSQNTGTYDAWRVFRDIANILFVILFIFVIFSQLTGVGIDNYGIKKILPKLIVGAILINMSYIICQAVIDVANIVGYGIGSLFQSLSNQIGTVDSVTIGTETVGNETWGSSFLSSAWNPIIVVVVAAFAAYTVLSQGLAIIIPALMLMISVAAAIFGLIAVLGIRQALSVILVVFSPLAFACYMLPNTKSVFDKWYSALKGVLIAYPICSAMIYGGDMVGNILMHAAGPGDTWLMISAAIISIAPVFFIPKVISASMGALSRGVMRVTGGMGRLGKGKLARSGFAMDMQRRAQMQKAGIKFDKNGNAKYTTWGKLQNKTAFTRGGKQRLDMQRRQAAMGNAQMGQAGLFMGQGGLTRMTNMNMSAQAAQEEQDVRDTQTSIGLGNGESYVFDEDGNAKAIYDDNGNFVGFEKKKVNASSIESLQEGLRTALVTGNTTDIKAYQNMLAAKGDGGRKAIADAMTDAQSSSAGSQKLTNAAVQTFSQNIMDNYAKDFKENARSAYNFANANQSISANNEAFSGPAMGSAEYMTKGSSLKSTQIGGMDDNELDSIVENIKTLEKNIADGGLSDEERVAAQAEIDSARAAASGALADSSIRGSIKQGNIDKLIEINGGVDPVAEQQKAQAEVAAAAKKAQDEQLAAINSINDQLKKRNNDRAHTPSPIIITGHNRHPGGNPGGAA